MIRKTGIEGVAHPALGDPTKIGNMLRLSMHAEIRDGRKGGETISRAEEEIKRYKYRMYIL